MTEVSFSTRDDSTYPILAFFVTRERIGLEDAYRILFQPPTRPSLIPPLRAGGVNRVQVSYRVEATELRERYREAYSRMRSMRATAEPGATATVAGQVRAPVPDIEQWQPPSWFPAAARTAIRGAVLTEGTYRFPMEDPVRAEGGDLVVWVHRRGRRAEYQYFQYFPERLADCLRMTHQNRRQADLLLSTFRDFNERMELLVEERQLSPDAARHAIHDLDIQTLRAVIAISVQMLSSGMSFAAINASAPRVVRVAELRGAQQRRGITSAARPPRSSEPRRGAPARPGSGPSGRTRAGGSRRSASPGPPRPVASPAPVMDPATIASQANIIVGTLLRTVRQGEAILARLAANDRGALRTLGIGRLPRGFNPANVEWGLGVIPGQGGAPPQLRIVRGGPDSVAWNNFPGMISLSHTHPPPGQVGLPTLLNTSGSPPSLNLLELIQEARTNPTNATQTNLSVVFPSASDYRYVAVNSVRNHRVITSLRYLGNGRIAVSGSGTRSSPPVVIRIEEASVVSHQGAFVETQAQVTITGGSSTLWRGRVRGTLLEGYVDTTTLPPAGSGR